MGTKRFKVQMRDSVQKQHQTMNKDLILSHDSKKDLFISMNEFEQETYECPSQNRARRAFVLITRFYFIFK